MNTTWIPLPRSGHYVAPGTINLSELFALNASYFQTCKRDEKGHCIGGDSASAAPSSSQEKPEHDAETGVRAHGIVTGLLNRVKSALGVGVIKGIAALDESALNAGSLILGGIKNKSISQIHQGLTQVTSSIFQNVHDEVWENALSQASMPGAAIVAKVGAKAMSTGQAMLGKAITFALRKFGLTRNYLGYYVNEWPVFIPIHNAAITPVDQVILRVAAQQAIAAIKAIYAEMGLTDMQAPSINDMITRIALSLKRPDNPDPHREEPPGKEEPVPDPEEALSLAPQSPEDPRPASSPEEKDQTTNEGEGESYFATCKRDERGHCQAGSGQTVKVGRIRRVFRALGQAEHRIFGTIGTGFKRLPGPVRKSLKAAYHAAFATYTAGQALAERCARERGLSEDKVAKLKAALIAADLAAVKVTTPLGAAAGLGSIAYMTPAASAAYILYSTARNPLATLRAAHGLIKDALDRADALAERATTHPTRTHGKPTLEELPERNQWLPLTNDFDEEKHPRGKGGRFSATSEKGKLTEAAADLSTRANAVEKEVAGKIGVSAYGAPLDSADMARKHSRKGHSEGAAEAHAQMASWHQDAMNEADQQIGYARDYASSDAHFERVKGEWEKVKEAHRQALDAHTIAMLRHKGAEAGEVDWRPTETIPEDYYAYDETAWLHNAKRKVKPRIDFDESQHERDERGRFTAVASQASRDAEKLETETTDKYGLPPFGVVMDDVGRAEKASAIGDHGAAAKAHEGMIDWHEYGIQNTEGELEDAGTPEAVADWEAVKDAHTRARDLHTMASQAHRGVEIQDVDWRPPEVIKEDYYAYDETAWQPLTNASFFSTCQRDSKGHCVSGTGSAPSSAPAAPAVPAVPSSSQENYARDREKLANDKVTEIRAMRGGANMCKRVTFEDGSLGIFKPWMGEEPDLYPNIKGDYYLREAAASELAEHLGMTDMVPPVTTRKLPGLGEGSIQRFVPDCKNAGEIDEDARYNGNRDLARAAAFDYLTSNQDRHTGNWMLDGDKKMVLIDHGCCFSDTHDDVPGSSIYLQDAAVNDSLPVPRIFKRLSDQTLEAVLRKHGRSDQEIAVARQRLANLRQAGDFLELANLHSRLGSKRAHKTGYQASVTALRSLEKGERPWIEVGNA